MSTDLRPEAVTHPEAAPRASAAPSIDSRRVNRPDARAEESRIVFTDWASI